MRQGERHVDDDPRVDFSLPLPDLHAEYLKIAGHGRTDQAHEDVTQPALVHEPENHEEHVDCLELVEETPDESLIIDMVSEQPTRKRHLKNYRCPHKHPAAY